MRSTRAIARVLVWSRLSFAPNIYLAKLTHSAECGGKQGREQREVTNAWINAAVEGQDRIVSAYFIGATLEYSHGVCNARYMVITVS